MLRKFVRKNAWQSHIFGEQKKGLCKICFFFILPEDHFGVGCDESGSDPLALAVPELIDLTADAGVAELDGLVDVSAGVDQPVLEPPHLRPAQVLLLERHHHRVQGDAPPEYAKKNSN